MPAIITHHLFGSTVHARLGDDAFPTNDQLSAFLLGNQGPDPLFFSTVSRQLITAKKLGTAMHHRCVARSMDAMREFARTLTGDARDVADAYVKGFVCHYVLDSQVHPFVYAWQDALTSAGVEGLGPDAGSFVHAQIEADIDAALLDRMLGETIASWRVHDHILIADNDVLDTVDKLYRYAAAGVYGVVLRPGTFARATKDYRTTVALLHSPTGRVRSLFGRIERVVHPHSVVQALSHRTDVGPHSEWDNDEHRAWTNPFTGEVSTASFDELFERAQDTALEDIALADEAAPSAAICHGVNFLGEPEPEGEA